jgi:hypothetical protein
MQLAPSAGLVWIGRQRGQIVVYVVGPEATVPSALS